jgi:hypothetical protein
MLEGPYFLNTFLLGIVECENRCTLSEKSQMKSITKKKTEAQSSLKFSFKEMQHNHQEYEPVEKV